jgi:HEAT repeats
MKTAILCLLVAASTSCVSSASQEVRTSQNPNSSFNNATPSTAPNQTNEDEVAVLVRNLQETDETARKEAKNRLRSLARESVEARKRVIHELIPIVEGTDELARVTSPARYDAWKFAIELFGDLKATEALDALIACIYCNEGIGGLSFDRRPALKAIIKFGTEAVPKLSEALRNDRPATRSFAALALGEIGGAEAKKALEHALLSERNKDVVMSIQAALRQYK